MMFRYCLVGWLIWSFGMTTVKKQEDAISYLAASAEKYGGHNIFVACDTVDNSNN